MINLFIFEFSDSFDNHMLQMPFQNQSRAVSVDVSDGVVLTEAEMKQLFNDAGVTYRSMKTSHSGEGNTQK